MALRLIPRSSRRSGFLVTVAAAMPEHYRQLDVSVETSEPRGFAVRVSCSRLLHQSVHRIPHPTFSDDRPNVPRIEAERGGLVEMICPTAQGDSFRMRLDRQIGLKCFGKLDFWRKWPARLPGIPRDKQVSRFIGVELSNSYPPAASICSRRARE
jgi:hypothetical protein